VNRSQVNWMNEDIKWMKLAIENAKKAESVGEIPVGAIIVSNNITLSSSYNTSISQNDPTAHAEVNAIREASKKINNYRILDAKLYVTLEPCAMCYGAIVHSRINEIIYGAFDKKTGVCGSCLSLHQESLFNHRPQIRSGILEDECSRLLKNFFIKKRV